MSWSVPLQKLTPYLLVTHRKGVSSLGLSKLLGITQDCAWHMGHRIRNASGNMLDKILIGFVEGDDMAGTTYGGNCSAIAFDPHNEGIVLVADPRCQRDTMRGSNNTGYATVSSGEDWETTTTGRTGNIKRSTDGGQTWEIVQPNIIVGIDGIVFDPLHPDMVYAGTMGGGVYRSIDGGVNWSSFNAGMTPQERTFNGVEYIGIQIQRLILAKDKRTLLALYGGTAGVYSLDIRNNATTWQEAPRSANMLTIWDMDKAVDGTLYVAPGARVNTSSWENFNGAQVRPIIIGGAFVSEDNGLTWRQIFDPRIPVRVLRTDPNDENAIYLGGKHRMWMSHKGKDTTINDWVELPGFRFVTPDLIVDNPTDTSRIYVTTFGAGRGVCLLPNVRYVTSFQANTVSRG